MSFGECMRAITGCLKSNRDPNKLGSPNIVWIVDPIRAEPNRSHLRVRSCRFCCVFFFFFFFGLKLLLSPKLRWSAPPCSRGIGIVLRYIPDSSIPPLLRLFTTSLIFVPPSLLLLLFPPLNPTISSLSLATMETAIPNSPKLVSGEPFTFIYLFNSIFYFILLHLFMFSL